MTLKNDSFITALPAGGAAADRADQLALYGCLIGSWEMDAVVHLDDGSKYQGKGEIHFGWVLDGRAIQDVWILPGVFHGTTLRVYDPALEAWHILWCDPLHQYYSRQIGRPEGHDIVQIGRADTGQVTQWSFRDIKPNSFRWLGERSLDEGETWQLQAEFHARRAER